MKKRGFTLFETLVVASIILVIIGLLFPTIRRAREFARRIHCMNNLRQIGIALHLYANDHGGKIPVGLGSIGEGDSDFWYDELADYLGIEGWAFFAEQYRCPTLSALPDIFPAVLPSAHAMVALTRQGTQGVAYNANMLLRPSPSYPRGVIMDNITNAPQTIFLYDCVDNAPGIFSSFGAGYEPAEGEALVSDRHSGGANVLWLDGSVSWHLKNTIVNTVEWWNFE